MKQRQLPSPHGHIVAIGSSRRSTTEGKEATALASLPNNSLLFSVYNVKMTNNSTCYNMFHHHHRPRETKARKIRRKKIAARGSLHWIVVFLETKKKMTTTAQCFHRLCLVVSSFFYSLPPGSVSWINIPAGNGQQHYYTTMSCRTLGQGFGTDNKGVFHSTLRSLLSLWNIIFLIFLYADYQEEVLILVHKEGQMSNWE